jgi:anti-sigma regulatory factor (Ser/Thr protein kinase)
MSFHLKIVMPSHPRFLCVVRAAVGELALVYGLSEESSRGIALAVDEALANIIRHAYKSHYDQEIELICQAEADHLEFRLLDQGEPPDPARICGQPLDDFSLGGRGTHLMKAVMDEVTYDRIEGRNQVKMIKRLPTDE